MIVSEIFGATFQGEGPSCGTRAGFVRLGRCNLDCAWCDTPYTWDWERFDPSVELLRTPDSDVLDQLDKMDVPLVVVTGGEPLLQMSAVRTIARWALGHSKTCEVETNGTRLPLEPELAIAYNVSPKLSGSGVAADKRYAPRVLDAMVATGAAFKFVVGDPAELDEVAVLVDAHRMERVWIMPEGTTADAIDRGLHTLAPLVLDRGWNLTGRLHVTLWGSERGR